MAEPISTLQADAPTGSERTAVIPAPFKKPAKPDKKRENLPPFKVLLHNDDVNTFEHVVAAILKVTTLTPKEAVLRTLEAHDTGVALLLVTHRERAELFVDQFLTFQLIVSIEPAD